MPGIPEWIFLAFLALLIFGPKRLPEVARGAGKMIARLKAEAASTVEELKQAADAESLRDVAQDLRRTQDDLKRTSRELTASASSALSVPKDTAAAPPAVDRGPAPFDPDAT